MKRPMAVLGVAALTVASLGAGALALAQTGRPTTAARSSAMSKVTRAPAASVAAVRAMRPVHSASDLKPPLGQMTLYVPDPVSSPAYLDQMAAAFDAMDTNGDGFLFWTATSGPPLYAMNNIEAPGTELLKAAYKTCYLNKYQQFPATKEKDPKNPGKFIEVAAHRDIVGWSTWREALKGDKPGPLPFLTPNGGCDQMGKTYQCVLKDGSHLPAVPPSGVCPAGTTLKTEESCIAPTTYPKPFSKETWMSVAASHFEAEDADGNGMVDADEAKEYFCRPK